MTKRSATRSSRPAQSTRRRRTPCACNCASARPPPACCRIRPPRHHRPRWRRRRQRWPQCRKRISQTGSRRTHCCRIKSARNSAGPTGPPSVRRGTSIWRARPVRAPSGGDRRTAAGGPAEVRLDRRSAGARPGRRPAAPAGAARTACPSGHATGRVARRPRCPDRRDARGRKQPAAGRANREQLTRHLSEAARRAEAEAAKLETANAELIETDTSLASAVSAVHWSCGVPIVGQRLVDCSSIGSGVDTVVGERYKRD